MEDATSGAPHVHLALTLPPFKHSVTAVAWAPESPSPNKLVLAIGQEDGAIEVWEVSLTHPPSATSSSPLLTSSTSVESQRDGGDCERESRESVGRDGGKGMGGAEGMGEKYEEGEVSATVLVGVCEFWRHSGAVHRLRWRGGRPIEERGDGGDGVRGSKDRDGRGEGMVEMQFASCGADHSVRLFNILVG